MIWTPTMARAAWIGSMVLAAGLGILFSNTSDLAAVAAPPAARPAPEKKHDAAEGHGKEVTALKQALEGPVDVYFDALQMESNKPGIAAARFVDLVDVTGKELLRFDKGAKEYWLVDPDTILAYRVAKSK